MTVTKPLQFLGMPTRHSSEQMLEFRLDEHGGWPLLVFTVDRGNFRDQTLVKDILIEKNQGVQCLPLG